MSDFVVPDMIEPITAWRSWEWVGTHLRSLNMSTEWIPKQRLDAQCPNAEPRTVSTPAWEAYTDWRRSESVLLRDLDEYELASYWYENRGGAFYGQHAYATSSAVAITPGPPPPPLQDPAAVLPPMWSYRVGMRETLYPPIHGACPDEGCSCGIYALDDEQAVRSSYSKPILGEVYLWGKVIDGERGYRAQYAYPKSFKVSGKHVEALEAYGVPILDVSKVQVAVTKAIPKPSRMPLVMRIVWSVNILVIVAICMGYAMGVFRWWNLAFLSLNAVAVVMMGILGKTR